MTYSYLDKLMASPTEPMPQAKLVYQLSRMYQGLHALEKEEFPQKDDWKVCSDAVNLMETFVDMGICKDESGLLNDAVKALAEAGERSLQGHPIRLSGQGIMAVRSVLEDYSEVLKNVSHRVAIECHRLTEKRLQEIIRGKKRPHDVTIGKKKEPAK
jgi:hypothetical protein